MLTKHKTFMKITALPRVEGRKTDQWLVSSGDNYQILGTIQFHAPQPQTLFDPECMRELADFCEHETRARKS